MQVKQSNDRKIRIYAERKVKKWFLWTGVVFFLFLAACLFLHGHELMAVWMPVIGFIVLVNLRIGKLLDHFIYEFLPEGIQRKTPWSSRLISYDEIVEGFRRTPMRITSYSFQIPMTRGWLKLYYETDMTRQRQLLSSYRYLVERIEAEVPELPNMTKILISEMDQRYYNRKKRRNNMIAIAAASLLLPPSMETATGSMSFLMGGLCLFVQYIALNEIAMGVYFGKQVEKKIEKRLQKYTQVMIQSLRISNLPLLAAAILAVVLNGYWIWR